MIEPNINNDETCRQKYNFEQDNQASYFSNICGGTYETHRGIRYLDQMCVNCKYFYKNKEVRYEYEKV